MNRSVHYIIKLKWNMKAMLRAVEIYLSLSGCKYATIHSSLNSLCYISQTCHRIEAIILLNSTHRKWVVWYGGLKNHRKFNEHLRRIRSTVIVRIQLLWSVIWKWFACHQKLNRGLTQLILPLNSILDPLKLNEIFGNTKTFLFNQFWCHFFIFSLWI